MKKLIIGVLFILVVSSMALAVTDKYGRVTDNQGRLISEKQFMPSVFGKTETMPVDRVNGNKEATIPFHNPIVQSVSFTPDRYVSRRVFHLTETKVVNSNYIACFEAKTNIPRYISPYFTYKIAVDKEVIGDKVVVVKDLDNKGKNMRLVQEESTDDEYVYSLTTTQDKMFCVAAY
ncbi:MAG: lysis protein [Siphoviridae sp. ctjeG17]|nr:MAG: lysis protein [Siphoviridae sp. ctjeG17]